MARTALIALFACGCLGTGAAECPGGGICPPGLVCRLDHDEQACVIATCGNGVVDASESCDDGNNDSGDLCPGDCIALARCGDGVIDGGEDCDDGNRVSGDGCQATCRDPIRPPARYGMSTAYDRARGTLVMYGGLGDAVYGDTWEWNGIEWFERHPSPPLPSPRMNAAMTFDPVRERVLMFGGSDLGGLVPDLMWEWDGTTWSPLEPAATPSMRFAPSLAFDTTRGVAVLFGGRTADASSMETWEWDGATWHLKPTPPPGPVERAGAAIAFDEAQRQTLMIGSAVGPDGDRTWQWDGSSWSSFESATAPDESGGAGMAYDRDRQVTVLFGGSTATSMMGTDGTFELTGRSWVDRSDVSARPAPRKAHGIAYVDSLQAVIVFGGLGARDPEQVLLDDLWSWDGESWREHL